MLHLAWRRRAICDQFKRCWPSVVFLPKAEVRGVVHPIQSGEVIAIPSSVPHTVWTEALPVTAIDAWSPVMRKYETAKA